MMPDRIALDLCAVDPKWQRQGVGRMLVRWGTDLADEKGVLVTRTSFSRIHIDLISRHS